MVDSVKEKANQVAAEASEKLQLSNLSLERIIEIGCFLVGGFIIGYAARHYLKQLIWLLLAAGLLIWSLHYFHLITFNYGLFSQWYGAADEITLSQFINGSIAWIKEHLIQCVAAVVGFALSLLVK